MWMRFTAMVVGGYLGNRRGWAVNRALLSFIALKKNRHCAFTAGASFSVVLSLCDHTWLVHYMSWWRWRFYLSLYQDELDDLMTSTPSDRSLLVQWVLMQFNFSAANTGTVNCAAAGACTWIICSPIKTFFFFFRFCLTNICWLILPPGFYKTTGIIHTATDGCVPGKRMFWWNWNCSL